MTSEQMTGTDVLALEQGVYLHSEEWEMQVVGVVDEISEDFFGVSLDVSDRDFVNAPQQGTELSAAAQGIIVYIALRQGFAGHRRCRRRDGS